MGTAWPIVIVEGNADLAIMVHEYLTIAGHDVRVTLDARSAQRVIDRERPCALVIDLDLEHDAGVALAEAARGGGFPIMGVTAWPPALDGARAASCDALLRKPFALGELDAALSRLIAQRRTHDPS